MNACYTIELEYLFNIPRSASIYFHLSKFSKKTVTPSPRFGIKLFKYLY